MDLAKRITDWDGKNTHYLERVYQDVSKKSDFVSSVFAAIGKPKHQIAATWLLKRFLEQKHSLTGRESARFCQSLSKLKHWQSKLHGLQCLPNVKVSPSMAERVYSFAKSCITADNKFVRAWAYGGLYNLSEQHPRYREEALAFVEMARHDEPASVNARIRQVLKRKR